MTTPTNPFAFPVAVGTPTPGGAAPAPTQSTAAASTTAPFVAAPVAQAAAKQAAMPGGEDPFSGPAPQQPRGPRLRDMYGRLLLIIPHKLEEGVPNRLSKDGGTQDRLTADVVILDGGPCAYGGAPEKVGGAPHDKTCSPPHKNSRMFVSSVGLISQCRDALAKKITTGQPGMVLGRLGVGEAKEGNAAPWLLSPPTDADKAIARQYLANVDPFA